MTVTIGRFSADAIDYVAAGNFLSVSSDYASTDLDDCIAARINLTGLRVGEVVPFTDSNLPELDGFYRVVSEASVSPTELMLSTGLFDWSIELERAAGGFGTGTFEITSMQADIMTTPDYSYREAWWPESAVMDHTFTGGSLETRNGLRGTWDESPAAGVERVTYKIAPSAFYEGAATIELNIGGTWYPIHGAHLPAGYTAENVRISNSLLRCYVIDNSGGYFDFDVYNSGWETDVARSQALVSTNSVNPDAPVTILRNEPTCVAVRYTLVTGLGAPYTVDIGLRRGAVGVDGVINGNASNYTGSVTTNLTGGTHTANEYVLYASGASTLGYFVAMSDADATASTETTISYTASTASIPFGIGYCYGTPATDWSTAGIGAFYGGNSAPQRFVLP